MHDPYIIAVVQPGASDTHSPRNTDTFDPQDWDLTSTTWADIVLGIVLAGAAYPLVAVVVGSAAALVVVLTNALLGSESLPPLEELIGAAIGMGMAGMIGTVIGAMFAAIIVIITAPFVYLFVRSLKLRCDLMLFGAVWGGIVGLLAGLIVFLGFGGGRAISGTVVWEVFIAIAIGPCLTTVLGQIGGTWGGARARRRLFANYDLAADKGRRELQPASLGEAAAAYEYAEQPRFQFGIRHMLWIMVWVSVLLSLMRLVGIPLQWAVPCLVGWLVYQTVTLYVGWRLIRRLRPWWLRPQTQLAGRIL